MLGAAYPKHTYVSYRARGCVHLRIDYMSTVKYCAFSTTSRAPGTVGRCTHWPHLHRCIHRLLHVNWTGGATYHVFIVVARSVFVVHLPRNGVAVFDSKLEGVEEGASDCVRRQGGGSGRIGEDRHREWERSRLDKGEN